MDFVRKITTAHTIFSADNPKKTTLQITKGRLVGGVIYFPPGPAGTLHVVVLNGIHQIIPANQGRDYALNDCVIPLYINLEIDQPPLTLDILTWNDSTTYDHELTLCLFLDPFSDPRERKSWISRILRRL